MGARRSIAVIIPAHNEVDFISTSLESIFNQTRVPDKIVVVDDFSSDGTGELVRKNFPLVTVIRPEKNLGSKARAQNFALFYEVFGKELITEDFVITIDADTSLAEDSIEQLSQPAVDDDELMATCGTVIPANPDNPFTLGRLGEYLYAFAFPKRVQQFYGGNIMIVSGCFGCYDTIALKARGGWKTDTLAEDMDLTADYHAKGYKVAYVHDAICYPVEPYNLKTYSAQMNRWSAAYFQNIKKHISTYTSHWVGVFMLISFLDAFFGGIMYPLTPLFMYFLGWEQWIIWFMLGDVLIVSIPVIYMGIKLHILGKALQSIPFVFFIRLLNIYFWFKALINEWILKKHLNVYVKGH